MTWWPTSEIFTTFLTELVLAPSTGIEPVAYRLGGGRSIRLSYEGGVERYVARNHVAPSVVVVKATSPRESPSLAYTTGAERYVLDVPSWL